MCVLTCYLPLLLCGVYLRRHAVVGCVSQDQGFAEAAMFSSLPAGLLMYLEEGKVQAMLRKMAGRRGLRAILLRVEVSAPGGPVAATRPACDRWDAPLRCCLPSPMQACPGHAWLALQAVFSPPADLYPEGCGFAGLGMAAPHTHPSSFPHPTLTPCRAVS